MGWCCLTALKTSSFVFAFAFAIFRAFAVFFGALGFDAVECFGAGGGLRSPATYSMIGLNLSIMLLRSAS